MENREVVILYAESKNNTRFLFEYHCRVSTSDISTMRHMHICACTKHAQACKCSMRSVRYVWSISKFVQTLNSNTVI